MNSRLVENATQHRLFDQLQEITPQALFADAPERLQASLPALEHPSRTGRRLPSDKWILSSAVQKLIRRGRTDEAVAAANKLHSLDPDYLPRRLPIIAFEDVGIGDPVACVDVLYALATLRASATQRHRVIACVVGRLARAVKSRAACDIFCIAHADRQYSIAAAKFGKSSPASLIALASDRAAALTSRALALHLLGGMSIQDGRWPRAVTRFNGEAIKNVARNLGLPPALEWLMIAGRHSEGLAAMLPLAFEAAIAPDTRIEEASYSPVKSFIGIPEFAADIYTRIGKGAFADFAQRLREKHPEFFQRIPAVRHHAKLGKL